MEDLAYPVEADNNTDYYEGESYNYTRCFQPDLFQKFQYTVGLLSKNIIDMKLEM